MTEDRDIDAPHQSLQCRIPFAALRGRPARAARPAFWRRCHVCCAAAAAAVRLRTGAGAAAVRSKAHMSGGHTTDSLFSSLLFFLACLLRLCAPPHCRSPAAPPPLKRTSHAAPSATRLRCRIERMAAPPPPPRWNDDALPPPVRVPCWTSFASPYITLVSWRALSPSFRLSLSLSRPRSLSPLRPLWLSARCAAGPAEHTSPRHPAPSAPTLLSGATSAQASPGPSPAGQPRPAPAPGTEDRPRQKRCAAAAAARRGERLGRRRGDDEKCERQRAFRPLTAAPTLPSAPARLPLAPPPCACTAPAGRAKGERACAMQEAEEEGRARARAVTHHHAINFRDLLGMRKKERDSAAALLAAADPCPLLSPSGHARPRRSAPLGERERESESARARGRRRGAAADRCDGGEDEFCFICSPPQPRTAKAPKPSYFDNFSLFPFARPAAGRRPLCTLRRALTPCCTPPRSPHSPSLFFIAWPGQEAFDGFRLFASHGPCRRRPPPRRSSRPSPHR